MPEHAGCVVVDENDGKFGPRRMVIIANHTLQFPLDLASPPAQVKRPRSWKAQVLLSSDKLIQENTFVRFVQPTY